jgi:C1A family cysteine protease
MSPVYNQGNIGSCTANAFCAAYYFDSGSKVLGSRLFLYYNERLNQKDPINKKTGAITADNGSSLQNGIVCLQKYGLCLETLLPYNTSKFSLKPSHKCYNTALQNKLLTYNNVAQTQVDIQTCLSVGKPIVLGFYVYPSFENVNSLTTGYVPMPDKTSERLLGGHAVLLCGYDMTKTYPANPANPIAYPSGTGVWIIKNSWGTSIGDKGYFYLPLPYLLDPTLTIELWCLSTVSK